ncbi:MAG: hypothetical protein NZM42_00520 [Gemmatales bacterium]|nr:hypothetical protein [Gemmatales bacterium]
MLWRISGMLVTWFLMWSVLEAAPVPEGQVAPEALLDGRCAIYLRYDGYARHQQVLQKTALAEVWHNGLREAVQKLGETIGNALDNLPGAVVSTVFRQHLIPVLGRMLEDGLVVGVQVLDAGELRWQITMILPRQAKEEPHVSKLLRLLAGSQQWKLAAVQLRDRHIQQIQVGDTGWHVSWWAEAEHLVLLVGPESPEATLEVLAGKRPSVLHNEWYKRLMAGPGYTSFFRGYVYGQPLMAALERLGPEMRKLMAASGLEDIPAITWHLGAEDRVLRSTLCVHLTTGKRRGLAALFPGTQSGIESYLQNLQSLPPLSPRGDVAVFQLDLPAFAQELRRTIEGAAEVLVGPEEAQEVRRYLQRFLKAPAMKTLEELLPHLDSVWFTSDATADGVLSTGVILGVQLKDSAAARKVLAKWKRVEFENGILMEFRRRQYRGVELMCLHMQGAGDLFDTWPIVPTLAVVDDWLLFSLYPQPIQGVILRREMKHWARWRPSPEAQRILDQLKTGRSTRLVGFSESEPRSFFEFLGSLFPLVGGIIHTATGGEFDPLLLPPTQALTEPLFPNVTVYLAEPDCLRIESYESVPVPSTYWWLLGIAWSLFISFAAF